MTEARVYLEKRAAEKVMIEALDHLVDWAFKGAVTFRNAVIGNMSIFAVNPILDLGDKAERAVELVYGELEAAVREGRMIDFGYVPNAVIKAESLRARHAFEAGDLTHPYETSWLGVMAWEGGYNGYFIVPGNETKNTMVIELYGIQTPDGDMVLLYDAMQIGFARPGDTPCFPAPMIPLDVKILKRMGSDSLGEFEERRAANSLDPLVTMLRFLADASIPITNVPAPHKLNKARARKGKDPLPGHTVVHTRDYVTTVTSHRNGARVDHGGHHASPIAHWRRSHDRHLPGRIVKVKSAHVNWRGEAEFHRIFYKVKPVQPDATPRP